MFGFGGLFWIVVPVWDLMIMGLLLLVGFVGYLLGCCVRFVVIDCWVFCWL